MEREDMEGESLVSEVSESMLPRVISGQVKELQGLEISIKKATEKAEEARSLANAAKEKSAGLFGKKEAIELLQSAVLSLAEAEEASVEAQGVAFECQKRIGEITKYLFALGCTNMAANRSVVRELKLILEGASVDSLDELARQEIINVIRQLKAEEDIMNKQNELMGLVKRQESLLNEQIRASGENRAALIIQEEKSSESERELILLKKEGEELRAVLQELRAELYRRRNAIKVTAVSLITSGVSLVLAIIGLFF